jgi:hypothetical protein
MHYLESEIHRIVMQVSRANLQNIINNPQSNYNSDRQNKMSYGLNTNQWLSSFGKSILSSILRIL